MKTDHKLGKEINQIMIAKGIETPMNNTFTDVKIDRSGNIIDKKERIEMMFAEIMDILGLNLQDDSLRDTPKRVAKMYIDEIFVGLDYRTFPKCTAVENKMKYDEMIIVDQINVQSFCEHHFVSIDGFAKVAYIPNGKVLGLSKFNRVVNFFSRRPQIQERLTEQIYHALSFILETEDIAVEIKASHLCVKSRGVGDVNSMTTTRKLGGEFNKIEVRNEFLKS